MRKARRLRLYGWRGAGKNHPASALGRHAQDGHPHADTRSSTSTGTWEVGFSCACAAPTPLPGTGQRVGSDESLKPFATRSTGDAQANPRFFLRLENKTLALALAQRRRSKQEQGTPERERAQRRKVVALVHERRVGRRGDFAHQHSRGVVNRFTLIALEDLSLKLKRLPHTPCLATSIQDAAWSPFTALIASTAAWAPGRPYGRQSGRMARCVRASRVDR